MCIQGVQEKLGFFHSNPSLAYISVRELQSSRRNMRVYSLSYWLAIFCTTNSSPVLAKLTGIWEVINGAFSDSLMRILASTSLLRLSADSLLLASSMLSNLSWRASRSARLSSALSSRASISSSTFFSVYQFIIWELHTYLFVFLYLTPSFSLFYKLKHCIQVYSVLYTGRQNTVYRYTVYCIQYTKLDYNIE